MLAGCVRLTAACSRHWSWQSRVLCSWCSTFKISLAEQLFGVSCCMKPPADLPTSAVQADGSIVVLINHTHGTTRIPNWERASLVPWQTRWYLTPAAPSHAAATRSKIKHAAARRQPFTLAFRARKYQTLPPFAPDKLCSDPYAAYSLTCVLLPVI